MSDTKSEHEATTEAVRPEDLLTAARSVYANAYAPYSQYSVAAAVLADNGKVYTGCNVENAVYPLTICAERAAIFSAVSDGARRVKAVAVVTANAGAPCGSCRQVMREFGDDDMPVFLADLAGNTTRYTLAELLPQSFSVDDLPAK